MEVEEHHGQVYCNELSLSPQSRAKLANINAQAETVSPLDELLSEEDD